MVVSDPSGVKVPISTDIIDEIPIPCTILSQAIVVGFNFDQVGGHFGLCIGNVPRVGGRPYEKDRPSFE